MSKRALRDQVIKLRLNGYTYGQIRRTLGVSKSTLSDWLRHLSLTPEQFEKLRINIELSRDLAREKFRITYQNKRLERLKQILESQIKNLLPLSEKELFLSGVFLYWGEGEKKHGKVAISNSDPRVIKFSLYWMTRILKIPKEKITVRLHLYKDMDIKEAITFWSETLDINKAQFKKPYIKSSTREGLTYKSFGHGTCNLRIGNVEASERIAMSIKAISDYYGAKNELFWYN